MQNLLYCAIINKYFIYFPFGTYQPFRRETSETRLKLEVVKWRRSWKCYSLSWWLFWHSSSSQVAFSCGWSWLSLYLRGLSIWRKTASCRNSDSRTMPISTQESPSWFSHFWDWSAMLIGQCTCWAAWLDWYSRTWCSKKLTKSNRVSHLR